MLDFIIKYWIEIFFGVICTIMACLTRHFWKLQKDAIEIHFKKQQEEDHQKIIKEIKAVITERDEDLLSKIEASNEEIQKRSETAAEHYESLKSFIENEEINLVARIEENNKAQQKRSSDAEAHFENLNENLQNLRSGMLSLQGVQFRQECRELLAQPEITTENWDYITQEWCAYKGLKGNHEGDALYHMIEERYKMNYNK